MTEAKSRATRPENGQSMLRKRRYPPMPAEQSRRQSRAVEAVWRHFGRAEPVIAFLNTRHEELNAQPLQLAIQSDEGLERVERLLKQLTLEA
jgi:hypothetical protein